MNRLLRYWLVLLVLSGMVQFARSQSQSFEWVWGGHVVDAFITPDGSQVWSVEDGGRIRHRDSAHPDDWTFETVSDAVKDTLWRIQVLQDPETGEWSSGWAVGRNGVVLKYNPTAAVQWYSVLQLPSSSEPQDLYGLRFVDADRGWIVGYHSIWYTTNGSSSEVVWEQADFLDANGSTLDPTTIALYGIDVVDRDGTLTALAIAEPGFILRNVDNEASVFQVVWDAHAWAHDNEESLVGFCEHGLISTRSIFTPWDVEITRSTEHPKLALVVGSFGNGCGLIMASTDSGFYVWHRELHECRAGVTDCTTYDYNHNPSDTGYVNTWRLKNLQALYGVAILSGDNSAVVAGYAGQHIVRDPSNGVWKDRSSYSSYPEKTGTSAVTFPLQGAAAATSDTAEIVGYGGGRRLTTDGGESWANNPTFAGPWRIKSVWFTDEQYGWQVSQLYRIAKTIDGGQTWAQQDPQPVHGAGFLNAIAFDSNGSKGVTVGDFEQDYPKILYTTDAGATGWSSPTTITLKSGTNTEHALLAVAYVEDTNGANFWTVGEGGLIFHSSESESTAAGVVWYQFADPNQAVSEFQGNDFFGVACIDATHGVVVGTHGSAGKAWAFHYAFPPTWTDISASDTSIRSLTDVKIMGNHAYAVGTKVVDGIRQGVILKSDYSSGVFGQFAALSGAPTPDACAVGSDLGRISVFHRLAVNASSGDIWVGGECGRVWGYASGDWAEWKSQTDAHIQSMSLTPSGYLYLGAFRPGDTLNCITRWVP